MNEWIRANRDFIRLYGRIATVLGCTLLAILLVAWIPYLSSCFQPRGGRFGGSNSLEGLFGSLLMSLSGLGPSIHIFFTGMLTLWIGRFLRHVGGTSGPSGWLIRHGDLLFWAYAVALMLLHVPFSIHGVVEAISEGVRWDLRDLVNGALLNVQWVAQVVLFVSIGYALRRLKPIIEEAKTLV